MIFPSWLIFLAGLVVITLGAELVLRGATRIAALLKIKPIIIGLTIVSIGSTMPELAVGLTAATDNMGSLAAGNTAGTNILNILLILGLSAAIRPLPLHLRSIQMDVPVMIGATILLIAFALDGILSRTDGILLIIAAIVYTILLIRVSKQESPVIKKELADEYSLPPGDKEHKKTTWLTNSLILLGGILLTLLGAELLISGAVDIARQWGVSDAVIGLTVVAIGTSTPELATTLVATYKDERDVAVGNLIGSCITNILLVVGCISIAAPLGINVSDDVRWFDLPLAALVAIVCYPVFRSDRMVSRAEGISFVLLYLAYLAILIFFRM